VFINERARLGIFRWRYNLAFYYKVALAFAFAGFTGISAQLNFYLPFTPVPVTMQVLPVLLSGVILGKHYGALSQLIYASLGALGLAWFAGNTSGIAVLTGASGGYIIAFIVAAWVIGYFTDSYREARSKLSQAVLMFSGVIIIYIFGAAQLSFITGMGAREAVLKGIFPFIPGDIFKAIIAIGISSVLLPEGSYAIEKKNFNSKLLVLSTGGVAITLGLFWVSIAQIKTLEAFSLVSTVAIYSIAIAVFGFGILKSLRG